MMLRVNFGLLATLLTQLLDSCAKSLPKSTLETRKTHGKKFLLSNETKIEQMHLVEPSSTTILTVMVGS